MQDGADARCTLLTGSVPASVLSVTNEGSDENGDFPGDSRDELLSQCVAAGDMAANDRSHQDSLD